MFINVDGADGTGKSTSLRILQRMLEHSHIPYLFTSEPEFKGCKESYVIRNLLMEEDLTKPLQTALFVIARKIHINKVIRPALKKHKVVISSRYVLSNLAYQGNYQETQHGLVDRNHVMKSNIDGIKNFADYLPDINFYFYMNPKGEVERLIGRSNKEDRFDKYLEKTSHLRQLQKSYDNGINELDRYHCPTMKINAGKLNQFQRATKMMKWIKANY